MHASVELGELGGIEFLRQGNRSRFGSGHERADCAESQERGLLYALQMSAPGLICFSGSLRHRHLANEKKIKKYFEIIGAYVIYFDTDKWFR
jgi:hypothetical protein